MARPFCFVFALVLNSTSKFCLFVVCLFVCTESGKRGLAPVIPAHHQRHKSNGNDLTPEVCC